jgi:uroporphyrinogen decarboxylase
MYTEPELFHNMMRKITDGTILYLQAQAKAGAQALQIFDSWAGVLAPCDFKAFALPYVKEIVAALQDTGVPIIYFANNGATLLEMSESTGADVLGLDWRINIGDAAKRVGKVALQGNLDPFSLLLPQDKLKARIGNILDDAKDAHGHIFNLGHGINQFTPPEQAIAAVEFVHELSGK